MISRNRRNSGKNAGATGQRKFSLHTKVAAAAGATLLTLAALELTLRWTAATPSSLRFQQDVSELQDLGLDRLANTFQNDPQLFWRFKPDQRLPNLDGPFFGVISNGQGLREDHKIPPSKAEDEYRVLFLGDSCTFGYGLDYRESFVEQTERLLHEPNAKARIECVNAGVPGYSLYQGWRYLETEGLALQPDVVVVCFGWNDLSMWDNRSDFEHAQWMIQAQPPNWLQWSRLAQVVWPAFVRLPETESQERPRLLPEEFRTVLEQIHASCREHSAELVLMVWAFRDQVQYAPDLRTPLQEVQNDFAKQHNVPLVDLVPVLQSLAERHGSSELFLDEGHATALANKAIAERLVEFLDNRVPQ